MSDVEAMAHETQMTLPMCTHDERNAVAKYEAKQRVAAALMDLARLYAEDRALPGDLTVSGPLGLIRVKFRHGRT